MKSKYLTHIPHTRNPQTIVQTEIHVGIQEAFDYLAPIYVPRIFVGSFLIPAIVDTSIREGWNKAGLSRTMFFKDGTTSVETLLTYESPNYFSYYNVRFTSKILDWLVLRLEGEWLFTAIGETKTHISWTYRAIPRNVLTRILVRHVLIKLLRKALMKALAIGKEDLESGNLCGLNFPEVLSKPDE